MSDKTFTILTYVLGIPAVTGAMFGTLAFGLYWTSAILGS